MATYDISESTNYNPMDFYQQLLIDNFFTNTSKQKILKMAQYLYKRRYGKTPFVADWMINWAVSDTIDKNRWKQSTDIHNLQILAAERMVERMVDMDFDLNRNWFDEQEQLQQQETPAVCGSHFRDKINYKSPNII